MKKLTLVLALTAASALFAADGAALYKTKGCMGCHGKDGTMKTFKAINGLDKATIVQKIKDYQAGKGGPKKALMLPNAKKLKTDAEIEAVAEYIATFK